MDNIKILYEEWQALQPVEPNVCDNINRKFMLEFNYNSNHIEGNTLTYGQTELLLMFGQVDGDAKMRDLEEMKAHNVGLKMMQEEAEATDRPLTEYFIRELHRTLLREDYEVRKVQKDGSTTTYTIHAGQYKRRPNSVITETGERFEYASPEETPALMTDLVEWYNHAAQEGRLSALQLSSLFHYRYIRIHPFEDGNGRIARLLVNFILLRAGYSMIIVRSDDKQQYLSALNRSDIAVGLAPSQGAQAELEQIEPFVEYMKKCLERALTLRIKAAIGESIEESNDFKKKVAIIKKNATLKKIEKTSQSVSLCRDVFLELGVYMDEKLTELKTLFDNVVLTTELPKIVEDEEDDKDINFILQSSLRASKKRKTKYSEPQQYTSASDIQREKNWYEGDLFALTGDEIIFSFNHCLYSGKNTFCKKLSFKVEYLTDKCVFSSNKIRKTAETSYHENRFNEIGRQYINKICDVMLNEIEKEIENSNK